MRNSVKQLMEYGMAHYRVFGKFPGYVLAELMQTHGIPPELVKDILSADGIKIEIESFDKEREIQQEAGRGKITERYCPDEETVKIWEEKYDMNGLSYYLLLTAIGLVEFECFTEEEAVVWLDTKRG